MQYSGPLWENLKRTGDLGISPFSGPQFVILVHLVLSGIIRDLARCVVMHNLMIVRMIQVLPGYSKIPLVNSQGKRLVVFMVREGIEPTLVDCGSQLMVGQEDAPISI
jgi:hypothetical protein